MSFSTGATTDTISTGVEAVTGIEGKPTPDELGIDLARVVWQRSGEGDGSIEIAFPLSAAWTTGRPVSAARSAPSAACWAGSQLCWNVESEVW